MKDVMKMLFGGDFQSQVYKKGGMLSPHQRYVLEIEGLTGVRKEAIESYISENNLSDNDVLNIVIGLGRKQLKGSDFSSAVVGVKGNDYSKKIISFAKANKGMKLEFGGDFQSGVYAMGGSLEAHGIKEGDTFIRTISGAIQKVRDKDGKIVYINLANGERDSQPPLPFNDGGEVTYYVNKDGIRVRSKVEPKEKLSEKESMAKHSQSKEARAYKRGGALIGNQKRIDMNHNGEIDAEDFKLLRSSMNGAWRNERKHVNHKEDYEVRYARPRPSRTGYKGKRNFETKSVVPKSQKAESGAVVKKKSGNPKMKEAMVLAKKIRKDGEKWTDAVKRAYAQIK